MVFYRFPSVYSIVGWEKVSSHRFPKYGTQRGWKRVTDENGFQKLSQDIKLPFQETIITSDTLYQK